eukprot:scaffold1610_cov257-Pinguiococcus_pyrenoidosus.AAC.31
MSSVQSSCAAAKPGLAPLRQRTCGSVSERGQGLGLRIAPDGGPLEAGVETPADDARIRNGVACGSALCYASTRRRSRQRRSFACAAPE